MLCDTHRTEPDVEAVFRVVFMVLFRGISFPFPPAFLWHVNSALRAYIVVYNLMKIYVTFACS